MSSALRWLLFLLCLSVLAGAMGWMSLRMLSMDEERRTAEQDAQVQEKVRLALWRMDSLASALLIRENARPPQHYQSFYAPEDLYATTTQSLPKGSALIASPLFGQPPDLVQLHFEEQASTSICTSPQAPVGQQFALANNWYANGTAISNAKQKLAQLSILLAQHPGIRITSPKPEQQLQQKPLPAPAAAAALNPVEKEFKALKQEAQVMLNYAEQSKRAAILDQNLVVQKAAPAAKKSLSKEAPKAAKEPAPQKMAAAEKADSLASVASRYKAQAPTARQATTAPADAAPHSPLPSLAGDLKPYWAGEELLLVRQATVDGQDRLQGVWLDWPTLRTRMLATVQDILPTATLQPLPPALRSTDATSLVTLPVRLLPGTIPMDIATEASPLSSALLIAWLCLLAAAAAIAFVLHRAMLLSERRGAFVSAVTHELRTPLTTFRLYSEMLAEDMVPEPEQRRSYLNTLCEESTRLMHLVENVLSYSRIERGRTAARTEHVLVAELMQRIEPRLSQRAQSCGLRILLQQQATTAASVVSVDPLAVEQILFNLTDNACKYAGPDCTQKELLLKVERSSSGIQISLRDYGPGLSATARKKLFQPFAKSATEAAHSAPGVGLGLALCRRLAAELGGKLEHHPLADRGTCFILTLPEKD